jgi:hypothetical protein
MNNSSPGIYCKLFYIYLSGDGSRNITMTINTRNGRPPNAGEMMALRIIMLTIVIGSILKDVLQVRSQNYWNMTGPFKETFSKREIYFLLLVNRQEFLENQAMM